MSHTPTNPLGYESGLDRRQRKRRFIGDSISWRRIVVGVVLGVALIIALMLPTLIRERQITLRVRCESNLRSIGQSLSLYLGEGRGHYPDSIEILHIVHDITPRYFVCPASNDRPAKPGLTTAQTAANIVSGGHLSFVYCGRGFMSNQLYPDGVLVYEPLSHHTGGSNVLFGDGHVGFVNTALMQKLIDELAAGHNPPRPEKLK